MGVCPLIVKFTVRIVPLTSNACPGAVEPIPTLPTNEADVPIALNVVNPDKVFGLRPLCVYAPEVTIPVVAVIAPALLTVKAFAPTVRGAAGAHVPIPTLPLVTTRDPWFTVEVPIPTLPELVS
jgi:hypothetical protein